MLRLVSALILMSVILVGCSGEATPTATPVPDPLSLVTQAAANIRAAATFRMVVERTGAPYYVTSDLGRVIFKEARAQYVAPNVIQATVRVLLAGGIQTNIDIFSRGDNQWYRNSILTANRWYSAQFAPGFNPEKLIAQDSGFQAALSALVDLTLVGLEQLEDGTNVFHLKGTANGPDVSSLMVGLIAATGNVLVDVYVDQAKLLPVRFLIVQPETVSATEPVPTTWTIDVYDINSTPQLDDPEVTATP